MKQLYLVLLFFTQAAAAQNLVPNNSFNSYTVPPDDYAQMCRAAGWSSATGTCFLVIGSGSPDYYHAAGSGGAKPPNTFWATVSTHSGGGMAGFVPWYASSNYREYIRCQLTSPLTVGVTYEVSMWLTNGNSSIHGHGTDNIGVCFSSSPINQTGGSPITSVTPQCEMNTVFWSLEWEKVTFYYTATAADQYMCIGNFNTDANTTAVKYGTGTSGAYVYLDDVVVQPITILPVELVSFQAELTKDNTVSLNWSTATEVNNSHFTLQRSPDGKNFSSIIEISGAGTTTELHEYSFIDLSPFPGPNYYRLIQMNINGSETYSEVKMVEVVFESIEVVVLPNPASDHAEIILNLPAGSDQAIELVVTDYSGRMVLRKTFEDNKSSPTRYRMIVEDLHPGTYLIQVLSAYKILELKKLIIM